MGRIGRQDVVAGPDASHFLKEADLGFPNAAAFPVMSICAFGWLIEKLY